MKKIFSILWSMTIIALSITSFTSAYTQEQQEAYNWARSNGITTQPTIEEAKMNSPLTRQAFAKMVVNYLENVIWVKQAISNSCYFPDESKITNDLLPYTKKACAYWIMWSDWKNFNPTEIVDRAQLWTVFSRILWWDKYNVEGKWYYIYHVNALKDVWIMNKIDNVLGEPAKRWDVMIMFQRMFSKFGYTSLTNDEDKIITFLTTKYSIFLEWTPVIDNNWNWESYYKNGQLEAKGVYKNWALNEEFLYYYKNWQLRLKCNFKDGIRNGEYVSYYENGQIMQKMNLKDGKTDGEEIIYNEDGRIVSTCNCVYWANSCNCVDYFAPKWELSDSAEITVEKNMVVWEATNLKITMMKDWSIMTWYTWTIIMMVTDESWAILYSSEYELNHGMYTFLPSDLWSKEFQKWFEIKKEWRFYIEIEDLNDETTLWKQLVTVRSSWNTNDDSVISYFPTILSAWTVKYIDYNKVILDWRVDDDSLISGYLINYWIDWWYSWSTWTDNKEFTFTEVPYDTTVNVNITPYRDNNTKNGKTFETQFILPRSIG